MATMNISIPDLMQDWVQAQVETGAYATTSDYVRDLIRQDQEHSDHIQRLQQAITEGLESGHAQDFNLKDFLRDMKAKHLD